MLIQNEQQPQKKNCRQKFVNPQQKRKKIFYVGVVTTTLTEKKLFTLLSTIKFHSRLATTPTSNNIDKHRAVSVKVRHGAYTSCT